MNDDTDHIETDGTAIDWDTECQAAPLNFYKEEWMFITLVVLALVLGVVGACAGWFAA